MNILQIEDRLKSVPDDNLQNEMTNPSGMFPQYLVMSEIQRRAKMRNDYEGRMAAESKTPPLPSIREQMVMEVSQPPQTGGGIANLLSQAQTQAIPQSPVMPQEPVRMSSGLTVPNLFGGYPDPYSMFGFSKPEDDPETEEDESLGGYYREKSEAQKAIEAYYKKRMELMPEKLQKQRKLMSGLNLLQAGIAVGTSAKPEELGKNLSQLIDSIGKTESQLQASEDKAAKEQIEGLVAQAGFEKAEKTDLAKAAELARLSEKEKATAEYMRSLGDKSSPIGQIAKEIKDGVYGDPKSLDIYKKIGVDEMGNAIYGDEIDAAKLLNIAKELQPTVQRGIASDIADILTEDDIDSMAVIALVAGGMSMEEAKARIEKEARDKKLELIRQYKASQQINPRKKQAGGVIQSSVQDFNDVIENISA